MASADSVEASQSRDRLHRFSARNRYGVALSLLAITYIQALMVKRDEIGSASVILVQLLTVYLVLSVSESTRVRKVAGLAFLVAGGVLLALMFSSGAVADGGSILRGLFVVNIALYAVAPVLIIRHIFRRNVVDGQTFLGAICAYFMIGMMFAFLFSAVELGTGTPFFTSEPDNPMAGFLFFSFVTITTTGYGDLVPAGEAGQTLAVWEALIGQFFLAAVVAKIVSAWRPSLRRKSTESSPDNG